MSTIRNYKNHSLSFNKIEECVEYIKKRNPEYAPNEKYKGSKILEEILDRNFEHKIPREIKWKIEEDYVKGSQMLADYFKKKVIIKINGIHIIKSPKEAITNIHTPGGVYENKKYTRGSPSNIVIKPLDESKNENEIKNESNIRLTILPNKNHFIHTAERTTIKENNYCFPCMTNSTNTIATKGSGNKSSKKTKGSMKNYQYSIGMQIDSKYF